MSYIVSNIFLVFLCLLSPNLLAQDDESVEAQDHQSGAVVFTDSERVVMGGKAVIDKHERVEKLVVIGGTAEVYGSVQELVVVGGYLKLKDGAIILKELVVVGGYVDKEEGVEIVGKQVDITLPVSQDGWKELSRNLKEQYFDDVLKENSWIPYTTSTLKILALLALALLGQVLTPGLMKRTREYLSRRVVFSALMGITTTLLVLPITMFLILSLVGIPLLPLQFSLLILFVIFGEIHMGGLIGSYMVGGRNKFSLLGTGLGLLVIEGIGLIPVIGWIKWLFVLAGFGATAKVFNQRLFAKLND